MSRQVTSGHDGSQKNFLLIQRKPNFRGKKKIFDFSSYFPNNLCNLQGFFPVVDKII